MEVLALEPYYGGSHRAFLDGWIAHSRHRFTLVTLPGRWWKWRMRGGALALAEQLASLPARPWRVLLCSDMLDLAQLRGLAPPAVARLPAVAYFHENQLTYPVRVAAERDLHFAFTNLTTALAADAVWFNSAFHRGAFLGALPELLRRLPDARPSGVEEAIAEKSRVESPGVEPFPRRPPRPPGPLRILWAARWEYDKDPETFFAALTRLRRRGTPFRVSVLGEQFRQVPEVFATAREELAEHIDHWGFVESREGYRQVLSAADVFVSTAIHEFFGISAVEAMAAGAWPLLPDRLAYPELVAPLSTEERAAVLYDGSPEQLAERLAALAERVTEPPQAGVARLVEAMERFGWDRRAAALDSALEKAAALEEVATPEP